jgi:hypothetical protein
MTNEIVALIVTAQDKDEAEQKAQHVIDNELVYHSFEEWELEAKDYDYGVIIGNGRRSQPPPILGEFHAAMKNSGFGEPISSPWNRTNYPAFVQIECVTSDSAKRLMS